MNNYTELIIRNLDFKDNVDAIYDGQYIVFRKDNKNNKGIRLKFLYNIYSENKLAKIVIRYYGLSNVVARRNQSFKILYKNYDSLDLNDIIKNLKNRKELKNYIN